ncbi:MAG: DUF4118 domain-containing protein [Chitinispirillia bacterium]|nr:DUF4118 domain-containing protein [Chitinispirillia bacterium]
MENDRPDPDALLRQLSQEERQNSKGKFKIFFGYSAGVGKTYAMLEEAHALKKKGVDVVIGYVEPHQRPATQALMKGLPKIPAIPVTYKSITLNELDIDSALKRRPSVILVDELAHTNAKGCRNDKRYQDIEELLRAGIDVYTTVNVQHIEGLHDVVESITGIAVRERLPDSVFDSADKVSLVDIEPEDLIARLSAGKIYKEMQAKRALENFFTKENLIALREISLRRTADHVNIIVERNKSIAKNRSYVTDEHIMICLSSSPANARLIRTAAKLAEALRGRFTALFVETSDFDEMSEKNRFRLRENIRLAEQLGAKIVTVYGDDVPYQIAEYAKMSGVSKVVLGHPVRRLFLGFSPPTFVDKLTAYAPGLDVYIIPNKMTTTFEDSQKQSLKVHLPKSALPDTLRTIICLAAASLIGGVFFRIGFAEANIITVYILASFITAMITHGKIYGIISSFFSVLLFNYFFAEPYFTLKIYDSLHPATSVIMLIAALTATVLTRRLKEHARQSTLRAYRTEVLLETSQKLRQAKNKEGILFEIISQIEKLTDSICFLYPAKGGVLGDVMVKEVRDKKINEYLTAKEFAVANWVFINNKHAGATTNTLSGAKCLYMSIHSNYNVFAVVGIAMNGDKSLDPFEKGLLISILDESAMVLEKENALEAQRQSGTRKS